MKKLLTIATVAVVLASCNGNNEDNDPAIPVKPASTVKNLPYTILAQYPHDTSSYTEGLEIYKGRLYESAGDYANSALQFGDLKTGKIERQNKMGTDKIFGEGLTIFKGKLYQLTYTTNIVYVYDVNDITKFIKTFPWPYEGWGLTNNGTDLIVSTGSANLYFVDPETFTIKNTVHVHDDNGPVNNINELEWVNGSVWANVYMTHDIIKINPETGAIEGKMNFNNLPGTDSIPNRSEAMNGIAYDSTSKSFFITGKRWPKIYEVKLN
ncbi:MAG: glutaminyl-peptide cyclotransferase [Ferruginibacter sp.]